MYSISKQNQELCTTWEVDRKTGDVFILFESSKFPIRLKWENMPALSGNEGYRMLKNGIKDFLRQINTYLIESEIDQTAEDITAFITSKDNVADKLNIYITYEYKAIQE